MSSKNKDPSDKDQKLRCSGQIKVFLSGGKPECMNAFIIEFQQVLNSALDTHDDRFISLIERLGSIKLGQEYESIFFDTVSFFVS